MASLQRKALGYGGFGLAAFGLYRYTTLTLETVALPRKTLWQFPSTTADHAVKANQKKQVLVIGGGVVGVSTARKLAQAGHSVALLEPRSAAGQECSAAAAGGMQQSNPTVDKDSWTAVLKCIVPWINRNEFKFFHLNWLETVTDPLFLRWLVTFTRTSLFPAPDQQQKQVDQLNFTKFAVEDMIKLMEDPNDTMAAVSGYNATGALSLAYGNLTSVPKNPSQSKRTFEPSISLAGDSIFDYEPSVRFQKQEPTSGKLETEARAASSERFTKELAKRCSKMPNVKFLYNSRVKAIEVDDQQIPPRITRVLTNRGVIDVPENGEVVIAAGAWTPHLLALMGVYCPVYPLKGYALSVQAKDTSLDSRDLPSRIVNDKYIYTSRLGDEIRITSIGEFSGWSTAPTPTVDNEFRKEAVRQFPQLADHIRKATTRCGHRPFVSDGIVLLGKSDTHANLFVSSGPGANGWKLAFGSGEIINRLICGETEEQISKDLGFNVGTFSPAGRVVNAPIFSNLCRCRWGV